MVAGVEKPAWGIPTQILGLRFFDTLAQPEAVMAIKKINMWAEKSVPRQASAAGAVHGLHASSTTRLDSVPMPLMVTSSKSFGLSHKGGVRAKPTPSGVPVAITSPACKVVN